MSEIEKLNIIAEWQEQHKQLIEDLSNSKKRIAELESQIEKFIDFVLSKIDCCDVCPITDTCINSEGTCSYASRFLKCEKEVIREWLIQFISRR